MKIKRVTDTFIERKEMVFIAIVETLLIKLLWNFAFHMIESTVYATYWKTKGILQQTLSVPIGIVLFLLYVLWWVWKKDPEYQVNHAKQYQQWQRLICAVRLVPAAAIVFALTLIWQEWSMLYMITAAGATFVLLAILALVLTGISRLFLTLRNTFGKAKKKEVPLIKDIVSGSLV